MFKLSLRLLTVILSLVILQVSLCRASATSEGYQKWDFRLLRSALEDYKSDYAVYPATDHSTTWFQKLKKQQEDKGLGWTYDVPESVDGFYALDVHGNPMLLIDGALRSVGRNGVHDGGGLDDLTEGEESNVGYWDKTLWPAQFSAIRYSKVWFVMLIPLGLWFLRGFKRLGLPLLFWGSIASVYFGNACWAYPLVSSACRHSDEFDRMALYIVVAILLGSLLVLLDRSWPYGTKWARWSLLLLIFYPFAVHHFTSPFLPLVFLSTITFIAASIAFFIYSYRRFLHRLGYEWIELKDAGFLLRTLEFDSLRIPHHDQIAVLPDYCEGDAVSFVILVRMYQRRYRSEDKYQ